MKIGLRSAVVAWALAVVSILSGCMAFQDNDARHFLGDPPATLPRGEAVDLHVSVEYRSVGRHATRQMDAVDARKVEDILRERLVETGRVRVPADDEPARMQLRVETRVRVDPDPYLRILAASTFFVVPTVWSESFVTRASLVGPDGTVRAERSFRHRFSRWYQLFLVFGAPFAQPEQVRRTMWNAVLSDVAVWSIEQSQQSPPPRGDGGGPGSL